MPYYLTQQIKSNTKGKVYGQAGEEVTIISFSDPVYLVKGKKESFSVHKSKLSESGLIECPEPITKDEKPVKEKKLSQAEKLQLKYLNSLK